MSSAWPIWSEPVTLGGGMTMVQGSASARSGRNRPSFSQCAYQRASISAGSKVLGSSVMVGAISGFAAGRHPGGRSALAGDPGDLAGDDLLDDAGKVGIEPLLEDRLEHVADDGLERAVAGRDGLLVGTLAKRAQSGERLAAGGGGILGDQGCALGDRIVELEHVLLGRAVERRRRGGTRAAGRAGGADAAVLGDDALDGGEYLLHRRVRCGLAILPHMRGLSLIPKAVSRGLGKLRSASPPGAAPDGRSSRTSGG